MGADRAAGRRRGARLLLATGLAGLAEYTGLVWFGIFGHDGEVPPCFSPHRDVFFPPSTTCTPVGGTPYRVTSLLATGAGAVLLLVAVSLLAGGLVLLLHGRRPVPPVRRAEPAAQEASS